MQCSGKVKAFIYGGIAICVGISLLAPFTSAKGKKNADSQIVASQSASDAYFKKLDETSGIAIAGFRDENGRPLLWAHNEKTSQITLINTGPANTLYRGAITMPGKKTRDAEDIAVVHDNGKGTIYLEDAGSNRKDMPVCVRYARKKNNPSQCSVLDSVTLDNVDGEESRAQCLARGNDWIWLNETDYLAPGVHPAIRRMPEPGYSEVIRGKLAANTEIIEFEYPRLCGDKPCREVAGNKMSDIARTYNTEALAVILEPDHSHTAYLFSKAHLSLSNALQMQHAEAPYCKFDSDGLSDVFRIRHIDSLSSKGLHQAEYVTTLDLSDTTSQQQAIGARVTAANFLKLSDSQGLLLIRTIRHALKWPISLATPKDSASPVFDVAGALKNIKPVAAAVPALHKKQGVNKKNQEAVAQLDESTIYYMGECKGLRVCSVAMVHDNHPYLAGDVDGNGRVNAEDVVSLRKFLSGEIGLYCKAAADVNADGNITDADVERLKRYVEGHGPAPVQSRSQADNTPLLSCGYYNSANRM
jgi:dockerin type I repeat protein